jgi:hypothetical protein
MIKGGKGGANTNANGIAFEKDVSLTELLIKAGYTIKVTEDEETLFNNRGEVIGVLLPKGKIYKYLFKKGLIKDSQARDVLSKRLLPDNAFYNYTQNTLYIIEVKFQAKEGSTDEKLQTCDFKKKTYIRLFGNHVEKVEFIYVLNDWFMDESYADTLRYVKEMGCHYYFKELPLKSLGL